MPVRPYKPNTAPPPKTPNLDKLEAYATKIYNLNQFVDWLRRSKEALLLIPSGNHTDPSFIPDKDPLEPADWRQLQNLGEGERLVMLSLGIDPEELDRERAALSRYFQEMSGKDIQR